MTDSNLDYNLLPRDERELSITGGENGDEGAKKQGGGGFFDFSRYSTFGGLADTLNGITREFTFGRSLTHALGLNYDDDDAWSRRVIDAYTFGEDVSTRDGDVPLPAGFAREYRFWRMAFVTTLVGFVMGPVALAFMNVVDYVPTWWADNNKFSDLDDCKYNKGKLYWIAIPACAGLIVGLIRWFFEYPTNLPGLFRDINDCHVNPRWAPLTFIISAVSLGGGASLGPEQALGNLGGGFCTYLTEKFGDRMNKDDKKNMVLAGMASALGALFPSPLLGILMIYELSSPPGGYMETICILSCGACTAFVMYYYLCDFTEVELYKKDFVLSYCWDFELYQCGSAFIIGIVSGIIGLTALVIIGIVKQIFARIKLRLERNKFLQNVLPPVLGGIIIGSVNYALPLTLGDGNAVIKRIVQWGYTFTGQPIPIPDNVAPFLPSNFNPSDLMTKDGLSTNLLVSTAFAKMFLLAVSMNCGFVGGFVFPTILVGIIAGVVTFQLYPYLPLGLCVSCFMSAVPGAICPMPFTLAGLAIFIQFNGLYQTVPIYIATLTSYTVVCGSGIFKALQMRAVQREKEARLLREQSSAAEAKSMQEEKTFVIDQYKGTTMRTSTGAGAKTGP